MQDILEKLCRYSEKYSTETETLLTKIERETHLQTLCPRMLSGQIQGKLLSLISMLKKPDYILEIGTFTGYSAVCLAQGLKSGSKVISLEYDRENAVLAQSLIKGSDYEHLIEIIVGDAKKIIPTLDYMFDIVFIDADKESYCLYYDAIIDKCHSGAIIIADNVLWSGKVLDKEMDKKTKAIHDFNQKIYSDVRVENFILPFRDGLNIMVKK